MTGEFYFIKKINDQWVEETKVIDDVRSYYYADKNNIISEKNQSRKCTDFFRIHLLKIPHSFDNAFVEELKYKIKIALIKLEYQKKKNKIYNFAKKINDLGLKFVNDLEILQKINTEEKEKYLILKKLISAFKNSLNQIYIINYK